jgi:glycosyltransferase involved in cell wall biosynthesis
MKIALLSFEYPPETAFGGIGTYTWYQARALVRLGHEVHVLAGATATTAMRTSEHDGVMVHRFRRGGPLMRCLAPLGTLRMRWTRNRLENALSMYQGVRELRREHRFDVIEMPECGAEGMLVNHFMREHTVVRFHSPARLIMPFYDVSNRDMTWCSRAEGLGISGAVSLTSSSTFLANQVRRQLGVERPIRVIPNGIDVGLFDGTDQIDFRERYGLPRDRPIIFVAARLERRKGVHLLRDIAVPILQRHEATLVLAGSDPEGYVAHQVLTTLQDQPLRGTVRYLGALDQTATRSGMRQSDIFLLPSLWESCPYSCLEAMAGRRAIVASNQGGMTELIEDGVSGLLARTGDAASHVEQIETAINSPSLRARLGNAARAMVEQSFSDIDIATRSVAAYGRMTC